MTTLAPLDLTVGVGDRLAAFSAFLPAEPSGRVLIATAPDIATALCQRYPGATIVERGMLLPPSGTVGLLIVDTRIVASDAHIALRETLACDGVVATIGRDGTWVLYPNLESPEQLWRKGWPIPQPVRGRRNIRRRIGLLTARLRRVPRLNVWATDGSDVTSLADRVATEVSNRLGPTYRLVGVVTAGTTVLRLRAAEDELAVHLSCTDPRSEPNTGQAVATAVPGLRGLVPKVLATGATAGVPWVATPWLSSTPPRPRKDEADQTSRALRRMAVLLSARPTGKCTPGWAEGWVKRVPLVPTPNQGRLVEVLQRLEFGLPLGWSHGDPWAGNVLHDASRAYVIDWGNSVDDAPLSLDSVLIEILAQRRATEESLAATCLRLLDAPTIGAVGGRAWMSWDHSIRVALMVSAHLLYLRNRAIHDLGITGLDAELRDLDIMIAAPEPAATPEEPVATTASGAHWIVLGAVITKASQTIVLLVLAAILAPSAIGVLAVGALVLNITSTLTAFGCGPALVYWRGNADRAARSALTVALVSTTLTTATVWLIAPWIAMALRSGSTGTEVIRGLALCLPFMSTAEVSQELLRRDLSFKRLVLPDIAGAVTGAGLSVFLAAKGSGAMSLVYGQLAQYGLILVLCWVVRRPVLPGWSRPDIAGLMSYGSGLAGSNVTQLLMLNVDYVVVAHYLGTQSLGVYSMAFRLAYMPYLLIALTLAGTAFPYLCRLHGADMATGLLDTLGNTLGLVVPVYLGMILLAPSIGVLGPQWASATPVLRWLAVYGIALSALIPCIVTLNASGRTRDTFKVNAVHLVLLAIMLLAFVHHGVAMVGVGQALAVVVALVVAWTFVHRRVQGVHLWTLRRRFAAQVVGAGAMFTAWVLWALLLPEHADTLGGLLIEGPVLLIAYALPVLKLDPTVRSRLPVAERRVG